MSAPRITVGMPVYNGADLIGESLDAVLAQTRRDFRVLVFDNASTDATPEIVARHAARDGRVVHHRQAENVGAGQNFLDALAAAETEFFAWRADDDLSSPDFLERLGAALEADAGAALAAPSVRTLKPGRPARLSPYRPAGPGPRIRTIVGRMFGASPAWIYGLWRTERLRAYYLPMWEAYPNAWAHDHLVILQAILDGAVTGDAAAEFVQRIGMRADGAPPPRVPPGERLAHARAHLGDFRAAVRASIEGRAWSAPERAVLAMVLERYVRKRVNASRLELAGWRIAELLGRR